ncbi:ethylene-responsive transcription factor 5-like [Aegilops tauschii subsp. strangulata]|uniref:ethylene-responsive transcription factor 5-like n=1 Tax=Aegilops tauschii subsp. strangulata TaxID=200361 RepID=UPI00098A60AF|nr:uncharacterized protein LOC109783750 [Aegilops tauschii subsp. strangulata]
MLPRKTPRGKTGFFGMRTKPSGNFGVEFSDADRRFWQGNCPTVHEAARAYDVAVWRAGRPKKDLNFLEIVTQADAEFVVPVGIRMEEITTKKNKRPAIVVSPGDSDEAAMARRRRKEDQAGPSTVISVEPSEEDRGESEEEDKGFDDPDKDEFWEQFESSNDKG